MTGATYAGELGLRVKGRHWTRHQRPPLSLTVLERPDRLLVLPSDQSGGLRGGDRLTTEVVVSQGGHVEWRPPTSALYFPDRERRGVCTIKGRLHLEAGTRMAWLPPVAIPCQGARVDQTVEIVGEPGTELLYWDSWADGRTSSGERGAFGEISNSLEVRWAGRVVFRERWSLTGSSILKSPDPAGFQRACQWHLALASGEASIANLAWLIQDWQARGETAEWGELDDGLWIGRVIARRPRGLSFYPIT